MCGRMRLDTDWTEIVRIFELDIGDLDGFAPHWNVAPTMNVPLLFESRRAGWGSWGFVPPWERAAKPRQRPINAKAETIAESGMFRQAFAERRCAVPITGFYEWETLADGKQPWLFARRDRGLFVVAGVWSRWRPEGGPCLSPLATGNPSAEPGHPQLAPDFVGGSSSAAGIRPRFSGDSRGPGVDTFAVLTTSANAVTGRIHDRMPVILGDGAALDLWLDPRTEPRALQALLGPAPDALLDARRVSRAMNSARADTAEACAVLEE